MVNMLIMVNMVDYNLCEKPNNKATTWGWWLSPICSDFGGDLLLSLPDQLDLVMFDQLFIFIIKKHVVSVIFHNE